MTRGDNITDTTMDWLVDDVGEWQSELVDQITIYLNAYDDYEDLLELRKNIEECYDIDELASMIRDLGEEYYQLISEDAIEEGIELDTSAKDHILDWVEKVFEELLENEIANRQVEKELNHT